MEPFIGQIMPVGFNFAPVGWAFCDGQLLPIASNTALFSLLGTIYGGDGRTTFALPDLRGRAPIHWGSGPGLPPYSIGSRAGSPETTLTLSNMPSHNHTAQLQVNSGNAANAVPVAGNSIATPGQLSGRSFESSLGFNSASPNVAMNSGSVVVGNNGGSLPFNNMQPYIAVSWVIALVGIYPSRS